MAFVHLHNHTEYSLLDGATHIKAMVKRAAELGMKIPQDIGVIGFDDIAISKNYIPALSTVSLHLRQLGVEAGNMIEAQFSGARQVHNTQVRCDLIIREST